jgi:integrase
VKRSGADKENTQEIYLRRMNKILKQENLEISDIQSCSEEELKELNQEIVEAVQNSKYKANSGEYIVRTKRSYWGSWKRLLEALGYNIGEYNDYMPNNVSFSSNRGQVDKKKKTTPEDLPDSQQVRQFLKTLGQISKEENQLRNQAIIGLIWDIGARIGEVMEDDQLETIKMNQVSVNGERVHIKVKGNKNKNEEEKKDSDRRVEVFQCRKLLKDYIEQHPRRNDPDAFLFYPDANNQHHTHESKFYTCPSKNPLRSKIHRVKREAGLEFKTKREPFHIFRKGMITYYVMNDILSWEKVCERAGKDPSSTMPIYLKMAMDDINSQAAEAFGLNDETREHEHRMIGPPLLPRTCNQCGEENQCIKEMCSSCGEELPEAEMPDNLEHDTEDMVDIDLSAKIGAKAAMNPDKSINEIKEEVLNEHEK